MVLIQFQVLNEIDLREKKIIDFLDFPKNIFAPGTLFLIGKFQLIPKQIMIKNDRIADVACNL